MHSDHALMLARWFEARLHDSAVGHSRSVRLYGIDLIDPASLASFAPDAARVSFVGELPVVERREPWPHDASAFVSSKWLLEPQRGTQPRPAVPEATADRGARDVFDDQSGEVLIVGAWWPTAVRPVERPRRRRARVVKVVLGDAVAAVARFDDAANVVVLSGAA